VGGVGGVVFGTESDDIEVSNGAIRKKEAVAIVRVEAIQLRGSSCGLTLAKLRMIVGQGEDTCSSSLTSEFHLLAIDYNVQSLESWTLIDVVAGVNDVDDYWIVRGVRTFGGGEYGEWLQQEEGEG
jgi:hypothetical protein